MCPEIKLIPWQEEPSLEGVRGGRWVVCWAPGGCVRSCFDVSAALDVCMHSRQLMQLAVTVASCDGRAAARDGATTPV